MKNEKNSQHNKRINSHRIISFLLTITICLCSYIPCIATVSVEIHDNDPYPFHGYSINTGVKDSFVDNGTQVFSKSWNTFTQNVMKMGSTISWLGVQYNNTIMPNLTSLVSNTTNGNGILSTISNTLGSINLSLTSGTVVSNIGYTIAELHKLNTIEWNYINYFINTDRIASFTGNTSIDTHYSGTHLYCTANNSQLLTNESYILCFYIPLRYYANGVWEVYDFDTLFTFNGLIVTYGSNNTIYGYTKYDVDYYTYTDGNGYYFYILNPSIYTSNSYFTLDLTCNYNVYYNLGQTPQKVYYMTQNNPDYYTISEFLINKSSNKYLDTIANNGIEASLDDSGIIDAINNLSLTDNDVKINVNVSNSDSQSVQNIIPFIRSFFDNNISLSDFVTESGDVQSNWFSQTNQDIMNSLSGGYINLYD